MNILHYIPTTDKKSLQALFLKEMIEGERDGMASHIVTMENGGEEQAPSSSDIDKLSPYSFISTPCGDLLHGSCSDGRRKKGCR